MPVRVLSDVYLAWVFASDKRSEAKALEYIELRDRSPRSVVLGARLLSSVRMALLPWSATSDPDSNLEAL